MVRFAIAYGGVFYVVVDAAAVGAIVPEVSGSAHITGRAELLFDPEDPLGNRPVLAA